MNKEEVIEEFFRSLRVTLTTAFSYPKDHPYFIKSVENFKLKLQEIQSLIDPFKIGVTDLGLVVEEKNLTRAGFYDELARLLHQRKIKSLEIQNGSSFAEIVGFFSAISQAPKDIAKSGGINGLLDKYQVSSFIIEELDYSAFLQENGQECVDVWGYMLKNAVQSNDQEKLNNLAENFGSLIKRTDQNDIFETEEIPANIKEFLASLKIKNKEQFAKCSKELFLWILRNKKSLDEGKLAKLKLIFDGLNQDDLSNLFWEGLNQEENFDSLSLELFSKMAEQKNPSEIAQNILNKASASQQLNNNPKIVRRVRNLLSSNQDNRLSAVYRNTLESLIKGIASSGELIFDQKTLKENYRYIILDILALDEDKDNLVLAAEVLEKELVDIFADNEPAFIKDLGGVLNKRKKAGSSVLVNLEKKFSAFVENTVLNQPLPADREFLLEMISVASLDVNFYLDKIFLAEKANKHILNLYFKFFPGNLDVFYARVQQRLQDIEFISSLIDVLAQLALPVTLGILDHIYSSANEIIKIEILNNMRKLKKVDAQFLLRQLATDSPSLRKNLLSVLILDPQAGSGALEFLFKTPSFCGSKNQLLIENMQLVFELGLIEAAGYIRVLSRRKFFWNRKLRDKANQILKEWNAF